MTLFLAYWLIGETAYSMSEGLTRADLADLADRLEYEAREQLSIRPEEQERLRKICFFAVAAVFFILPLFWPLALITGGGDDDLFE